MTLTAVGGDVTEPPERGCWCCGDRTVRASLLQLDGHREVGVCFRCVDRLAKRKRAIERMTRHAPPGHGGAVRSTGPGSTAAETVVVMSCADCGCQVERVTSCRPATPTRTAAAAKSRGALTTNSAHRLAPTQRSGTSAPSRRSGSPRPGSGTWRSTQLVRMVVGRSDRRTDHRRRRSQRGPRGVEGRRLLHVASDLTGYARAAARRLGGPDPERRSPRR